MNRKLKVLDLFSGIGGFALGLDSTGFFETVKFVEKDKYCQKVLRKNFPNIPIEEDIKNVEGKEYSADVVVGGFPCQPFSVAGKQKGTNDDRYLWPEMLRLIREIKPEFVIGENVQGIINLQNGMVLRQVQDDLESEGFEVQCFLIPASGIGAWHQRYRVWIVAANTNNTRGGASKHGIERKGQKADEGWKGQSQSESSRHDEDVSNTDTRLSIGENQEIQARRDSITSSSKDVSNTNSGLRGRRTTIGESGENKVWGFYSEEKKQTRVDIRSKAVGCDVVSGGKTWWQIESDLCGVPNGISYELDKDRANRIKTLGNAIVPQIARELGLAIKKVVNEDTNI